MSDEKPPQPQKVDESYKMIARDLLAEYKWFVGLGVLGLAGYVVWQGRLPDVNIPPKYIRYAVQFAVACVLATIPAYFTYKWFKQEDRRALHEVDPIYGTFGVRAFTDAQWETLSVVDGRGESIDKAELHNVQSKKWGEAYECERYDSDAHTAHVSWMAGFRPTDIRRHKSAVYYVRKVLGVKSSRYDDLRANIEPIVRDALSRENAKMLAVEEGVNLPDGSSIEDSVQEALSMYGVEDDPMLDDEDDIADGLDIRDPRENGESESNDGDSE